MLFLKYRVLYVYVLGGTADTPRPLNLFLPNKRGLKMSQVHRFASTYIATDPG